MMTALLLFAIVCVAGFFYWLWERRDRVVEETAVAVVRDIAAMGDDVSAASLHPQIDPSKCIGSGACVRACPEKVVVALVGGYAKLVNPLGCIGHGACESACPVGAITLVYGDKTRGLELPRVDPFFQTNRRGVYVIGELGGMGLIRNAVSQGKQAADHVIAGTAKEPTLRRGVGGALDALVVGAGPAGISATLRLMEAGLKVHLIDREGFGGTILHYPRAKVVMTGAIELPIYGTLKKRTMSKEALVALWQDILARTQPPFVGGELVERLSLGDDDMWSVHSTSGVRRAANVLLALGVRGSPQKLGVSGEDLPKVAYRLLEPTEFEGKRVLVVGGGNSAVESAIALADYGGCASVAISYRRAHFARCRGENRRRIEEAIAQGKVTALMSTEVQHITEDSVTLSTPEGPRVLPNDGVIVQIGGTSPSKLLRSFGVEIITKYGEA
jgi:thioredoxin reductase (NADPH)